MAKVNLSLPRNLLEGGLDDSQRIARIESYLYQLNEQLRYELTHIDEDNMGGDGLSAEALSPQAIRKIIDQEISTAEIDISGNSTVVEIMEAQKRAASQYNTLNALVQSHSTSIKDLRTELGKKAASGTVDALSNRVTANETSIQNLTTELGKKAASGTVDALSDRVTANETSIQTLTTDKAAKSTVDALSQRLTTDETTISGLNTNLTTLSGNVSTLQSNYNGHYHGISCSVSGGKVTITQGAVRSTAGSASFDIAATQFYRDGVAAARPHSLSSITLGSGDTGSSVSKDVTVFCADDEEIDLSTTINASAVYTEGKKAVSATLYGSPDLPSGISSGGVATPGWYYYASTVGRPTEDTSRAVYVRDTSISQSWVLSFSDVTVTAKSGGRYNVSGKVTIRLKLGDNSTQDLGPYTVSKIDV